MRHTMCPAAKDVYSKLRTDQDRHEWIAGYLIDPELATATGWNKTIAFKEDRIKDKERWVTQAMLGGPKYMNSDLHAEIVVNAGVLEWRKHEVECLADKGVLQYKWNESVVEKLIGKREEAGVLLCLSFHFLKSCSNENKF